MADLTLPPLPQADDVTVGRWLKQPGDALHVGERLLEVFSDRFDWDIPAASEGILREIRAAPGSRVSGGAILAVVEASSPPANGGAAPVDRAGAGTAAPLTARITPLAARIAAEHGVDLSPVQGSGASGRVTKADVLALLAAPPTPAPSRAADSLVELTPAWRARAEQVTRSRQAIPQVTTFIEVDMGGVRARIERMQRAWQAREGFALDELPFIVLASVGALHAVPLVNSAFGAGGIARKRAAHIGIAGGALIAYAEVYNLVGIARRIHAGMGDGAAAATFSIDARVARSACSGALFFTAPVREGQAATLGVGALQPRAVVVAERIAVRPMSYLSLSYDHRVVDGIIAGQFLSTLKNLLESI